jgi:phosphoribosylglycinamide formyltransferase 1
VSGGGSNLEAILNAQEAGRLISGRVASVVSSRSDALALERARRRGIAARVVDRHSFADDQSFQDALLGTLRQDGVEIVCLAGYLKKLGLPVLRAFQGRILNIHPALLPKFGGPGMYGHFVHEAVLKASEKESGCSVHLVDEEYDHGAVLAQARVPIQANDTPETLAARILEKEHELYPQVLQTFCEETAARIRKERTA